MASLDYSYRRLVNILGPERVSRSPVERLMASHDIASLPKIAHLQWKMVPDFVVIPKTTEEVKRLVEFSYEAGLPLVPRGGGSGLVGGGVPNRGGILVDMRQMNRVLAIDPGTRRMTVQAGLPWKEAQAVAGSKGLFLPVAPLGAPASTIAGWYSNGGTGVGSFKYGSARDLVLDLEVVLPSGEVVRTADGNLDLAPGYADLNPAFFGAEGTLGIVTQATFRVYPKPEEIRPLTYSFPTLAAMKDVASGIAESDLDPYHVSLYDPIHLALRKAARADATDPQGLVNVVLEGPKDEVTAGEKEADALLAGHRGTKLPEAVARYEWENRFDLYPARRLSGGLVISESLVPVGRYADAVTRSVRLLRRLKLQAAVNAFLADRNTAAMVPYFPMDEQHPIDPTSIAFVKKFGDLAFALGGHPQGLGLFTGYNFPKMHKGATGMYSAVKGVLDPHRKVNPGKTVEVWTRWDLPLVNVVPPEVMRLGLEVAAAVRRIPLIIPRIRYVKYPGGR